MNDIKNKKYNNQINKEEKELFNGEDSSKYGEFISSFFSWIPVEKQKRKAEELNNIEKNKEKNK